MKLIAKKPIYHQGTVVVEGAGFETREQHGRELIAKGYAELVSVDNPAEQPEQPEQPEQAKKSKK